MSHQFFNKFFFCITGLPLHEGKVCFLPDLPILETEDLPWLIGTVAAKKARFKFWTRTLERSKRIKYLLVNSFPNESCNNNNNNNNDLPIVLPIGPLCGHINPSNNNPISLWEEDMSCLDWLDKQEPNSVVYVSFGSWVSPIGEAKLTSLALSLEASNRPFIWVLKSSWCEGLPKGFIERVCDIKHQAMIVSWAPQMAVLRHKSVGCYLTHCGWNSTMEAIQFKKRMLCYPVAGDQFLNCAYIVQVWKVGMKLNGLGEKDVEQGLKRVMEDVEMETRLIKLKENAIMGLGAFNLKAFVRNLKKHASTTLC